MPYYKVIDSQNKEADRLILAANQVKAIRHVGRRYTAEVASTHTVASMLMDGVKIEVENEPQP
jgi:hypothetical protein